MTNIDLKPGDRVRRQDVMAEVVAPPFRDPMGAWRVPVYVASSIRYDCWPTEHIAREAAVLLRVTGPEHAVEYITALYEGKKATMALPEGVRVERLEGDPDGGER